MPTHPRESGADDRGIRVLEATNDEPRITRRRLRGRGQQASRVPITVLRDARAGERGQEQVLSFREINARDDSSRPRVVELLIELELDPSGSVVGGAPQPKPRSGDVQVVDVPPFAEVDRRRHAGEQKTPLPFDPRVFQRMAHREAAPSTRAKMHSR